jgi:hypothetical protein
MKMNPIYLTPVLAASLAMFAGSAHAKSLRLHKSPSKSAQVTLVSSVKLADGTQLEPGTYKVEVSDNAQSPEALFYKGSALIARSPVKLESQPQKSNQTAILTKNQGSDSVITEIQLSGRTEKLVFGNTVSDKGTSGN